MTSRRKIAAITKAAKKCNCAVYLKTGMHPPGVMIGECDGDQGEEDLKEWVASVKLAAEVQRLQASAPGNGGARSVAGQNW